MKIKTRLITTGEIAGLTEIYCEECGACCLVDVDLKHSEGCSQVARREVKTWTNHGLDLVLRNGLHN